MIKVSIIVPCYNAENYINICFDSIMNDKLEDKEIIFINDGSKDNTLKILQSLKKKYKNIVIIDQENGGQAVGRNNALKKAKGEYVTFVDIDDFVAKDMFYKLYSFAKKKNCDYVYCDYFKHYINNDIIVRNEFTSDLEKNKLLVNFAPWGKLISKKLIDEIDFKFLEVRAFEDVAVIPYLGAKSKNAGYLKESLYYYNMTNESTMRQKKYNQNYLKMFEVSDHLYSLFANNNLIDQFYDELEYIYIDSILKTGVIIFSQFKESLNQVYKLRNNVFSKIQRKNVFKNRYIKNQKFYIKFVIFLTIYLPSKLLYCIKRVK